MVSRRLGLLAVILNVSVFGPAGPAIGQEANQAARRSQLLTPLLDSDTFAVVRVDVEKIDVRWLYGLAQKVPDLLNVFPSLPGEEAAVRIAKAFRAAGGKELYIVLSTRDLPEPRARIAHAPDPFVLVPLVPGADADAIGALLRDPALLALTGFDTTEQFGEMLFAGSKKAAGRLQAVKPSARPELVPALEAAADSAVQLVVVPIDDNRRVLEQWILPAIVGDANASPLIRETTWASIGLSTPPRVSLKVAVGTRDVQTAERIESAIGLLVVSQGQREIVRESWPQFDELAKFLTWKHDERSVSASLDDEHGRLSEFAEMAALRPLIPAVAAQARHKATMQLMQLGIALHNYHDAQKSFPAAAIASKEGKPLLSWRVALLPYIEEINLNDLYKQFHLDEPWDSPHNSALVGKMPISYRCPKSKMVDGGRTVYLAPRGETTVFPGVRGVRTRDVTDGTSKTIFLVEVDDEHAVPWTKPDDWDFDPDNPAAGLGGHFPGVFLSLFCDGSVHVLKPTIDKKSLRAMFTRNGDDIVIWPDD